MRYYSSTAQAATLTADLAAGATSMTVSGTTGFPASHPFTLVIDPGTGSEEIVDVTASSGATLTITRGRDGTAAQDHTTGAQVRHMVTARDLREAQEHINATTNVHGTTGTLVTADAAQTLTNKTIDGSQNTLINIPVSALQESPVPAGSITAYAGSVAPEGWLFCDGAAVSRTTHSALFNVIGITYGSGDGSSTFNLPNLRGRIPVGLDASLVEFDTLGEVGGEKAHTLTASEMPSHSHSMNHTHPMAHTHPIDHSHTASASSIGHSHSGTTGSTTVNGRYSTVAATNNSDRILAGSDESGRYTNIIANSTHTHSFSTDSNNHTHTITVNSFVGSTGAASASSTSGASSTVTGPAGSGAAHNNLQPYITLNYIIKT